MIRDLQYALRMLRRSPGFTAVAVLSLALGIGANTAIFSVVDALMLKALPVPRAGDLVLLRASANYNLSYAMFEKLRDGAGRLAELAAVIRTDRYNAGLGTATGAAGTDQGPVRLALVSGTYFSTLGVGAARGRVFAADDDRPRAHPVALVSDSYWATRFARTPDILGRTITLGDITYDVVGVAPAAFTGDWVGRPADVWIPIVWQPRVMVEIPLGLPNSGVTVIGRLASGVSMAQAEGALQIVFQQDLHEQFGPNPTAAQRQQMAAQRLVLESGARGYSPQRTSFGSSVTILMLAVGLTLLVACANIASLLLARSESRRREMAVRLAIGADRSRLVRQLLTESVVLAALGGAIGLVFAQWATDTLGAFLRSGPVGNAVALSLDLDVRPDARFLAFTAAVSLLTGVLFGLVPAFRYSRGALASSLTGRSADHGSGRGHILPWKLIVIGQVALSLVLLVAAGLLVRTLRNLAAGDLGFDRDHLLLVWTLPGQTGGRGAAAADFWHTVQERLAAIPGVVSASASNQGVLSGSEIGGGSGPALRVEGEPLAPSGLPGLRSFITPGFFATMGIRILAGRDFNETDTTARPRGVIISQTLARHYFGDRNPVGHRIWFPEDTTAPTEVIGESNDFIGGTPRETLRRPATTYFSYRDKEAARRLRNMTIAVRTAGDPRAAAGLIRQALREVDVQLPVLKIDTVDEQLNDVLVQERLTTTVSGFFGGLALLLACLGLYGVISATVARRTSEIGIRMALGATRAGVLGTILGESLVLVAAGVAIGVPAALSAARLLAARLFGVGPADPFTLAGAVLLMTAVTALAGLLPALRAARVDPMIALRCE